MDQSRRLLVKAMSLGACLAPASGLISCSQGSVSASDSDWIKADQIRSKIIRPQFADRQILITEHGAISGGEFDCTLAIDKAIKSCHALGGGKVVVPAGTYKCGPIHLLSNVNLHLEKDSVIEFITDPSHYLPEVLTRWEGLELMGYSPLIYAYQQKNIAITGAGTLDGMADEQHWWPWKGKHSHQHWDLIPGQDQKPARQKLMQDAENAVPVSQRSYGDGAYLRPPFIQPYACENVLIEGITIKNSPFWLVNPVLCQHVTVKGVSFLSHGPNSDGCDPESCNYVLIEDCIFNTGDDCIAIKSGRNADGRRIATPCQNIVIANCTMMDGHGGVVIGSEISGGVRNVYVENCRMSSENLERAIRIKTNSVRGGVIENIRIRNIEVGTVINAVVINFFYEEGDAGRFDPIVRDISIDNLVCQNVLDKAFYLQGFERAPITDIHIANSQFIHTKNQSIVSQVKRLSFDNVQINGQVTTAKSIQLNT